MHINNIFEKFKIRLITKDFTQVFDINYENTFAFIIKFDILRMFLVIVMLKDLKYYQVNVNNAFIEFFLKKNIYIILLFKVDVFFS